jgi:hypothetical protein
MKLEISIAENDFLEFYRFSLKSAKSRTEKKAKANFAVLLFSSIAVGIVFSVVLKYFNLSFRIFTPSVIVSVVVIVFIFLIFLFLSLKKMHRNTMPRKDGVIMGSQSLEINDEGVCLEKDGYSSFVKWKKVVSFEESASNFYIFIDTTAAYIVPKRCLEPEDAQAEFCSFVKNQMELASKHMQADQQTDTSLADR